VPARVFGSSGGAITGLALVARYPGHVETLIAHEPPLALLLPEAEAAQAGIQAVYDTFRERGVSAAWEQFSTFTSLDMRPPQQTARPQPPSAEAVATSQRFFAHGLLPIALYRPDLAALKAASARVVVAGGTSSRGQFAQRTAMALADHLDTQLVEFPGGHNGFITDPKDFVGVLRRALT
jgi:pimeloyl-ACP methyl ester carboxylesterase